MNLTHHEMAARMFETRVLEGWVNVFDGMHFHATKEAADKWRNPNCIACVHVRVEYKIGEGLE